MQYIDWKSVSLDLFFEFIIKHYKIIETYEMESFFTDKLLSKIDSFSLINDTENLNANLTTITNEKNDLVQSFFHSVLFAKKKFNYYAVENIATVKVKQIN